MKSIDGWVEGKNQCRLAQLMTLLDCSEQGGVRGGGIFERMMAKFRKSPSETQEKVQAVAG